MKKRILVFCAIAVTMLSLAFVTSCTENIRARQFGGKEQITLKPNEKLINITWKDADMWVLTEDTLSHIKYFRESSSFGVFQGEISIHDQK